MLKFKHKMTNYKHNSNYKVLQTDDSSLWSSCVQTLKLCQAGRGPSSGLSGDVKLGWSQGSHGQSQIARSGSVYIDPLISPLSLSRALVLLLKTPPWEDVGTAGL